MSSKERSVLLIMMLPTLTVMLTHRPSTVPIYLSRLSTHPQCAFSKAASVSFTLFRVIDSQMCIAGSILPPGSLLFLKNSCYPTPPDVSAKMETWHYLMAISQLGDGSPNSILFSPSLSSTPFLVLHYYPFTCSLPPFLNLFLIH